MPSQSVPTEFLYRTSVLVESFSQVPSASAFLKHKMFPKTMTVASDLVSVEFYKGNQKLAPYCSRFQKAPQCQESKFS
jgi:hypothetical protein